MIDLILALLLATNISPAEIGNASVFGTKNDKWAGGRAACRTLTEYGLRLRMPIDWHRENETMGIAHRTLPCNTKVRIRMLRTGRTVIAEVVDRGPFGACTIPGWKPSDRKCQPRSKYWRVKKNGDHGPGVYRSIADLLPATAKALGHRGGLQPISLVVLPKSGNRHRRGN